MFLNPLLNVRPPSPSIATPYFPSEAPCGTAPAHSPSSPGYKRASLFCYISKERVNTIQRKEAL